MKFTVNTLSEVGRYQAWIVFLFTIVVMPSSLGNIGILFITWKIDYWCNDPAESFRNLSSSQQELLMNSGGHCSRPNISFNLYSSADLVGMNLSGVGSVPCDNGLVYSHYHMDYTATEQYELSCGREWLISLANTVYMLGFFVSALLTGTIADKFGRKIVLFLFCLLGAGSNLLAAYAPVVQVFLFARFLSAVSELASYTAGYILVVELMKTEHRLLPGLASYIIYSIVTVIFSCVAIVVRNHQHIQLLISVTSLLCCPVIWILIPESPKWFMSQKRHEEAHIIVSRIASFNSQSIQDAQYLLHIENKREGANETYTLLDLVRTPILRKRTMIMCFQWFMVIMVFYALTFSLGDFGPDVRTSVMITSVLDIPGLILVLTTLDRFGRQVCFFAYMLISGLFCLAMAPLVGEFSSWLLALALLGKLFAGCQMFIIYQYTPELYPTVIRTIGLSTCSAVARISGMLAPQVVLLNAHWAPAMVVFLGVASIVSAALAPFLPDTTGHELTQTVEEAERFQPQHRYKLILPTKNVVDLQL